MLVRPYRKPWDQVSEEFQTVMTRRTFLAASAGAAAAAAAPAPRSSMGFSPDCFVLARPARSILDYMQYAYEHGAGGAQGYLTSLDPHISGSVRERAEKLGMYIEITIALPKEDTSEFEKTVGGGEGSRRALHPLGVPDRTALRDVLQPLGLEAFVKESHARLARAVPILEKHRVRMGLENHKDWTVDQMVPLLKQYSSEYLGACIDWGNNVSLLDDAMEVDRAARCLSP